MAYAPPVKISRPALAQWLWERGLTLKQAGELFTCSYEQVRAICLPFSDPGRRVPAEELMERIVERTAGEIRPADFYPPRLNGQGPEIAATATELVVEAAG